MAPECHHEPVCFWSWIGYNLTLLLLPCPKRGFAVQPAAGRSSAGVKNQRGLVPRTTVTSRIGIDKFETEEEVVDPAPIHPLVLYAHKIG